MGTRIPLEEAVNRMLAAIPAAAQIESATLPFDALGRVLAGPVVAPLDLPPFNRSPLDGYAVRHQDIAAANHLAPVTLQVIATLYAGDAATFTLHPGQAARVMTGAELPNGATCVVRQEDATANGDTVEIFAAVGEFRNYIFRGEDFRAGETTLYPGVALDSGRMGVLGALGVGTVPVFAIPRIAILSTGSELLPPPCEPAAPIPPGRIYDANTPLIAALVTRAGARVAAAESEKDDPVALAATMRQLLENCDALITTGGVSVGEKDRMPEAATILGADTLFHGIQIKPGSPAMGLSFQNKPVLCLSGNPFAAFATFLLLAVPVLRRLGGCERELPLRAKGKLNGTFPKASPSRRVIPAHLAGDSVSLGNGGQSGRSLASLAGCNCLLDIPAGTGPLRDGEPVEAFLL